MAEKQLTDTQASALVGVTLEGTNVVIPPLVKGWLPDFIRNVHQLNRVAALANNLRVFEVEGNADAVGVAPGRCTIGSTVYAFAGADPALDGLDDNATHLVYAEDDGGGGLQISSAGSWPGTPHLKLAEVTLEDGEITGVLDRRLERMLTA